MCQRAAYEPSKESQNVNEIEEGEIVKDDTAEINLEEKKFYNYKGRVFSNYKQFIQLCIESMSWNLGLRI